MSRFLHLPRTYARRFRWELAIWVLVTTTASLAVSSSWPGLWLSALARVEGVAVLWILLRLSLADAAFGTLAGREVRPVRRHEAALARLTLLLLALVPAIGLRLLVAWKWTGGVADPVKALGIGPDLLRLAWWFLLLQVAALLIRGRGTRKVIPVVLVILGSLMTVVFTWFGRLDSFDPYRIHASPWLGTRLDRGLFDALPPGAGVIGGQPADPPESGSPPRAAAPDLKIPLREGHGVFSHDGLEWRVGDIREKDGGLELVIQVRGLPSKIDALVERTVAPEVLLSFPEDLFGAPGNVYGQRTSIPLQLSKLDEIHYTASFSTPLGFAWNRIPLDRLLDAAELWILHRTDQPSSTPESEGLRWDWKRLDPAEAAALSQTTFPAWAHRVSNLEGTFLVTPVIPTEETSGLAAEIDACMTLLRESYPGQPAPRTLGERVRAKGARALPYLLDYPAWSAAQWQEVVRPLLMEHAGEGEKPRLLSRLPTDLRLFEVFVEKGWTPETLPPMRERVARRQAVPGAVIGPLAGDPTVATDDLAACALLLGSGAGPAMEALARRDDFDRDSFVAEGWRRRKYGGYGREGWLYAGWAAERGDRSALHRLAEKTVRGKIWERDRLRQLVPDAPEDLLDFLRTKLENLEFDPASGTWRLDE